MSTLDQLVDFSHLEDHCGSIPSISASEHVSRQSALVQKLRSGQISAYIAEPGSNARYFANISTSQWHLSERPFLVIITPSTSSDPRQRKNAANVTILAPRFELERAKQLSIPFANGDTTTTAQLSSKPSGSLNFIDWAEDADPFAVLRNTLSGLTGDIVLDDGMRKFVADGLVNAGFSVKGGGYPSYISTLREQKSAAELDIMRCANEVRPILTVTLERRPTHC